MKLGRNNQRILSDNELHNVYEKFKKKKESLNIGTVKKYHKEQIIIFKFTKQRNVEDKHHKQILNKIIKNLNEKIIPSSNSPMSTNRSSLNEYHHNSAKFHYIKSTNENYARRSADKKHLPRNFNSSNLKYEIDMGNILKSIDDNYNKYKSSFAKSTNQFNYVRDVEENNRSQINLENVDTNLIAENAANRIVDQFIIKHQPTNLLNELNIEPINLSELFDKEISDESSPSPVRHLVKIDRKVQSPFINTERTFVSNKIINDHVDWRTRRIRRERSTCSFRTLSALSRESSFVHRKDDNFALNVEKLKYTTPVFGEKNSTRNKRSHSVRISDRLEIISPNEPAPNDRPIEISDSIKQFIEDIIEKGKNQLTMEQLKNSGRLLKFDDGKIMELSKEKTKLFLNKSYTLQSNQESTNQKGILRKPPPLFTKKNHKNNEKQVLETHLALLPICSSSSFDKKSNMKYKLGRNGKPAPPKPFSETYLWKSWQYMSMTKAQQLNMECGRVINDEKDDHTSMNSDENELRNVIDKVNLTSQDYHMMETIRVNNNYTVFDYVMKERLDGIKRSNARPVKLPKIIKSNGEKTNTQKLHNTPVASELCLRKSLKSYSSISMNKNGTNAP
ncbi:hypothetical protein SNEBB_010808 [Seison nebaliae]|nr:hypothetical protein SNEBB_010808 [Seison nebaliae]